MRLFNRFRRTTILQVATERLQAGESLDAILNDYKTEVDWLEPLLMLAVEARTLRETSQIPPADRVLRQFQAEARRARSQFEAEAGSSDQTRQILSPRWWQRIANAWRTLVGGLPWSGRTIFATAIQLIILVAASVFLIRTFQSMQEGGLDPTPIPGRLNLPTGTPTIIIQPTESVTSSPIVTEPITATLQLTETPTLTATATETATVTPSPTATPSPSPTLTGTATETPQPAVTPTPSPAATVVVTATPTLPPAESDDQGYRNEQADDDHEDETEEGEEEEDDGD